jgi:protein TonB
MNEQRLAIALSLAIHAVFLGSFLAIPAVGVNPYAETFYVSLTQGEASPSISQKKTKQITRSKTGQAQSISKPEVLEIKQFHNEFIVNEKPVMAAVQKAENPTPAKEEIEPGVKSNSPKPSLQGTGETVITSPFGVTYLNNPKPGYPAFARRMGMQGTVMLKVLVSRQGTVLKIEVAHSSGYEILDKAAAEAVRNWRFVPARQWGSPVEEWVQVPVAFHLTNNIKES